jgi:hypothetical protein
MCGGVPECFHKHTPDINFEHIYTILLMLVCMKVYSAVACVSFFMCVWKAVKSCLALSYQSVSPFACSGSVFMGLIFMKFFIGYLC